MPQLPEFIEIADKHGQRTIALLKANAVFVKGENKPSLFWLGGFKSDMEGSKAKAIDAFALELGLHATRFDYSGHGKSSGEFSDGCISCWLDEALEVFDRSEGEQIIIGSSMGGWLALLLNNILQKRKNPRVKAIILIAPAIDMTKDLMADHFSEKQLSELLSKGSIELPSDYDEPYIITNKLIEDGKNHLLFGKAIETGCPVYILQGSKDEAVPPSAAIKLLSHIMQDPVFFTMVPDGDHSLSRPQDLALLKSTISRIISDVE